MRDDNVIVLAKALQKNSSLQELHLATNYHIRNKGAVELAKLLLVNTSLKKLNLGLNDIGNKGAVKLAKSLVTNETLQVLNLRDNDKIDATGVAQMADLLQSNYSLIEISLDVNNKQITEIIDRNKKIYEDRRFKSAKVAIQFSD